MSKSNRLMGDELTGSREITDDDVAVIDNLSVSSFNQPSVSLLLRYGDTEFIASPADNIAPPTSSAPLRKNHSRSNNVSSTVGNSFNEMSEYSVEGTQSIYSSRSRNNKKAPRPPQKLVSGSQFRFLNKEQHLKCDQCDVFDKVIKKNKETVRSLKFQLARLEEQYHDLKLSKSFETLNNSNVNLKLQDNSNEQKQNKQSCEICIGLEHEIGKLSRLLAYERTSNEGLRKAFFDLRGTLEGEINTGSLNNERMLNTTFYFSK